jgi:hypothetical protein
MSKTRPMVALTALTWLALGVGAKGDITYNIVDYASISTPFTVSGTITTNGAIGTTLPASDIVSWNITITQGSNTILSLTTADSIVTGPYDASTEQITVASFNTIPSLSDELVFSTPNGSGINWSAHDPSTMEYLAVSFPFLLFDGFQALSNPVATSSAVPEPSTRVLAGCGIGGVIAYVLVRKRRERRREAVA